MNNIQKSLLKNKKSPIKDSLIQKYLSKEQPPILKDIYLKSALDSCSFFSNNLVLTLVPYQQSDNKISDLIAKINKPFTKGKPLKSKKI